MKENNKANNSKSNDFEYEALLKSEGEKINSIKHDPQPSSDTFQYNLKMKILEKRREKQKNNMKKIFQIFLLPIQPKYSVSAISLALIVFTGLNAAVLMQNREDASQNIVLNTVEDISEDVVEGLVKVKDVIIKPETPKKKKVDDWQYAIQTGEESLLNRLFGGTTPNVSNKMLSAESDNLGFSTGGAKDVDNLRQNIENNYLPLPTDITYEGLFYDYYFDTGQEEECEKLFCPSYSYAVSLDPFSKEPDYYLSVGLNSNIKESDFQRKKLNLVVVLDISGSMSSPFNQYYYDRFGNRVEIEEVEVGKSKMAVAAESVVALLDHLEDDDRFGMVLFNQGSHLAKPLSLVEETDIKKIKDHIIEVQANGSTNMSAGMQEGTELYKELLEADQTEYENRIIFLTDAMPNTGETSKEGLLGMTETNSENKIYSTFIGIGLDFNTELIELITKIKGANYYSVHSSADFKNRMDDEFEYMVTPLVFDLALTLESVGYEIEKVYGSPEANEATGELMKVNTLFPSSSKEGETRGGMVLLKLKRNSSDASLKLKVSYKDRRGTTDSSEAVFEIAGNPEYFDNMGIRKGVLLVRYADLIKNWINEERANYQEIKPFIPLCVTREIGIEVPDLCGEFQLGQWERQSISLRVASAYKSLFEEFKTYFEKEKNTIGDDELNQEIEILDKLINL